MTSCAHPPTHAPTEGPITQARDAAEYLRRHNINGLLSGMMAGLMMALPEDHVDYMQQAVSSARDMGLENVDWQTFVQALHPYKDPLRRKLFHPPVPVQYRHIFQVPIASDSRYSVGVRSIVLCVGAKKTSSNCYNKKLTYRT